MLGQNVVKWSQWTYTSSFPEDVKFASLDIQGEDAWTNTSQMPCHSNQHIHFAIGCMLGQTCFRWMYTNVSDDHSQAWTNMFQMETWTLKFPMLGHTTFRCCFFSWKKACKSFRCCCFSWVKVCKSPLLMGRQIEDAWRTNMFRMEAYTKYKLMMLGQTCFRWMQCSHI